MVTRYPGPPGALAAYEDLVATVEGLTRKGKANPYTSVNGRMTSFLSKEGDVAVRLAPDDRRTCIEEHETELAVSYGAVMEEFVVLPDDLLATPEAAAWFRRSWDWMCSRPPGAK